MRAFGDILIDEFSLALSEGCIIHHVVFLPPEEEVLGHFIGLESVRSDAVLLPEFG